MGVIKSLPESVYTRIAAGEVIVNPAAAVKELIENGIDAGATGITVEIADGGRALIRVTDNGYGMAEEDLPLAVERHATSKIQAFDDLYTLGSLGFRGEALSSMAEISRFTLSSRQKGAEIGAQLTVRGGEQIGIEPVGGPEGTTVRVEDLFFNVPARRKFLKSGVREGAAVSETVRRAILSSPEIAFKYIRNGRVVYQSPGNGSLRDAIATVYGPENLRELVDVSYGIDDVRVSGFISRPSYVVKTAHRIDFYVNGRYIESKSLQKALVRGYGETLFHGHYPMAVLNLTISPEQLDINVHPAKLTAMFYEEDQILRLVSEAAAQCIGSNMGAPLVSIESDAPARKTDNVEAPASSAAQPQPEFWVTVPRKEHPSSDVEAPAAAAQISAESAAFSQDSVSVPEQIETDAIGQDAPAPPTSDSDAEDRPEPRDIDAFSRLVEAADEKPEPQEAERDVRRVSSYRILGSAFATYLVCEADGRLFFIDQHAARERLTYERMLEWSRNGEQYAQMLLIPIVRTFQSPEFDVLQENAELLSRLGLRFEEFGELTLRFFSLPVRMGTDDVDIFLDEVVEELRNHPEDPILARDHVLASACRHSVKGGTELTEVEMQNLLHEITSMDCIPFCPHGRPIAIEITRDQLEKGFRRRT